MEGLKEECNSGYFSSHDHALSTKTAKHLKLQLKTGVPSAPEELWLLQNETLPLPLSRVKGVRTDGTKPSVHCLLRLFSTSVCLLQLLVLLKLHEGGSNMLNGSGNKTM